MGDVFAWWFWIEALGLVALPPAFLLFRRLPDRGYFFAKPLGLLLLTYLVWLAGSFHLLPNGRGSALLILLVLIAVSLAMLRRCRGELAAHLSRNGPLIIFGEGLFLLLFLLWAAVRAHNPDIAHTEQPMDFAFFNASRRAEFFPPQDPWLSGYSVSYYYFGYLMMATISNLSGVLPAISYNLALASLFALTGLGAFSLVYNMVAASRARSAGTFEPSLRAAGFGLLGALFVLGIGNLEGGLELLKAHGFGSSGFWQSVGIKDLANPYHSSHWYPTDNWWWWRATRVIGTICGGRSLDYTITEFPFVSALLGDLLPHVMA
ncbi:MAG: hypothetical protein HY677_02605, partial [Chloroflexi bacterium]|nr:hypothetical protein [Chloroflexota bacterium]